MSGTQELPPESGAKKVFDVLQIPGGLILMGIQFWLPSYLEFLGKFLFWIGLIWFAVTVYLHRASIWGALRAIHRGWYVAATAILLFVFGFGTGVATDRLGVFGSTMAQLPKQHAGFPPNTNLIDLTKCGPGPSESKKAELSNELTVSTHLLRNVVYAPASSTVEQLRTDETNTLNEVNRALDLYKYGGCKPKFSPETSDDRDAIQTDAVQKKQTLDAIIAQLNGGQ